MCPELTELLCIGCLKRLTQILKIKFGALIPNIKFAYILTQGNFTRDKWSNLFHLFNIKYSSSTYCVQNSSLINCPNTMAKRMQEQKSEERIVTKSKSTTMTLFFTCSDKFLIRKKSDCIQKSRDTHSHWET